MLLFYVDEVGNGGKGSLEPRSLEAHPWFILGALGIKDVNRQSAANAIRQLKTKVFGRRWESEPWNDTEIKGSYVARAARRIADGKVVLSPPGYRGLTSDSLDDLIDGIYKLFRRFRPLLYVIGIDKHRHKNILRTGDPFDPVAISYAFLQQRLIALVEQTSDSSEGALILADEERSHESIFRKGEVRRARMEFQRKFPKMQKLSAIIEKPVWVDTEEMIVDKEILQLTDFMLYAVSQAIREQLWDDESLERLGPYFARHWGPGRKIGAVWNAGITIYPRPHRYPTVRWAQI